MKRSMRSVLLAAAAAALLGGCGVAGHSSQWESVDKLVAVIHPTGQNKVGGTVWFTQVEDGVKINADITGLTPNAQHAFHIHDYGDATASDAKSAGDHYNPGKHPHGRPEDAERHAGDFGNLQADAGGNAKYERVDQVISLVGLKNPIIGRAVIIHAGQDKFVQPTGDAGPRIGIGIIGIAQPK